MDTRGYQLGYRSDIEGLRAVAILLVVAAHAGVPWLAGGFVGVDVFFVLSGYLITGLILQEIEKAGRMNFANFYARRFRRLLPALLLLVLCTCLLATILLAPGTQGEQAIAAATASVWMSNIHFAFGRLDYFSPGATSNLFLHTWSLGVEEQFYLVWPALTVWTFGKGTDRTRSIRRLKTVMFAIVGASLLMCIALTYTSPQMAFYMMPLRAWQFATGALAWLYFKPPVSDLSASSRPGGNRTSFLAGWIGLALIITTAYWLDSNSPYPGWRALFPTLGTGAIIVAGIHTTRSGVSRLLSSRPFQAVGRVSYSWYLWHWPVLLLGATVVADGDASYRAGLVLLSLMLAIASYRWVESPIRHQKRWLVVPRKTVLTAVMLMAVTSMLCLEWFNASATWANNPVQRRYVEAHSDVPLIYSMGCDDWFQNDQVKPCAFGPHDAKHTAILMGDSIGAQWFPAVVRIFNRPDWRLLVLTKSACPMVDQSFFYPRIGRQYTECDSWRTHALHEVAAWHPDIVILGSTSGYDFDRTQWVGGTTRVLNAISAASGHIYILRGTPHLPFDGPDCLSSRSRLPWRRPQNSCIASSYEKNGNDVYQWLQQAGEHFGNVTFVDMNAAACPGGVCHAESEGMVVFRDSQHLTTAFIESLTNDLAKQLQQPTVDDFHSSVPLSKRH
ncbi:MAG TPA: acyltransferase family protein [Rhodanobacter sp.]